MNQPQPNENPTGKKTLTITPEQIAEAEGRHGEISGETLMRAELTEIPYLVKPLLQQTGLACLFGCSDTGKSTILRQLAVSIVTGEGNFLGFPIQAAHNSVIYVSTEDDETALSFLLNRQAGNYNPGQLRHLRFIFDFENLLQKLDDSLTARPADAALIDCFGDIFGGDLKDSSRIRACLSAFQQLAVKHKCLILFLHHSLKRTEHLEPSKNNLLSGQGLEAKMRLVVEFRADQMDPTLRHWCIVKANYMPGNCKKESYVLKFDEQSFFFSNTGDRVPFALLARQAETDEGKAQYLQALDLYVNEGKGIREVAELMGFASKTSIIRLFQKGEKNGWGKNPIKKGDDNN